MHQNTHREGTQCHEIEIAKLFYHRVGCVCVCLVKTRLVHLVPSKRLLSQFHHIFKHKHIGQYPKQFNSAKNDSIHSMLFVQFPWPLLAIIEILTKDLHLFSPHNMFRRLAPCSRGGFEMNGKLCNRHQTLYLPPERKSGDKYLQKHNALKNFIPSGVSLPRGSPAIFLPLLSV